MKIPTSLIEIELRIYSFFFQIFEVMNLVKPTVNIKDKIVYPGGNLVIVPPFSK
jgi:hypothetical protein